MSNPHRPVFGMPIDTDVLRLLEAEAERHPAWADVQNRWGLVLFLRGRLSEADQSFSRCLELNPRYAWAALNLAQCLAVAGNVPRAREILRRAPEPAPGLRAYVGAFMDLVESRVREGLAQLDGLPPELRDRCDFLRLRASLLEAVDEVAAARVRRDMGRDPVLRERPENENAPAWPVVHVPGLSQLWMEVSSLEARLGRMDEAESYARRAYLHWADRSTLLHQRGFLASLRGDDAAAVERYEQAAALSPTDPRPLISLSYHWSALGELDRAQTALAGAIERAANYADLHHQMGLVLRAQGRTEDALAAFRRALELNPAYLAARLDVASSLFDLGRWGEACEVYQHVLHGGLRSSDIYLRLGEAEENLEHQDEAETAYREALRLNPGEATAHYHLGRLYRDSGDSGRAREAWSKYLELSSDPDRSAEVSALLEREI